MPLTQLLAPNAADRAAIVPGPQAEADEATCNGRHCGQGQTSTYRRSWATLLARVFRIDVTTCPGLRRSDEDHRRAHRPQFDLPLSSRHGLAGAGATHRNGAPRSPTAIGLRLNCSAQVKCTCAAVNPTSTARQEPKSTPH